jgi:hypothetical protein
LRYISTSAYLIFSTAFRIIPNSSHDDKPAGNPWVIGGKKVQVGLVHKLGQALRVNLERRSILTLKPKPYGKAPRTCSSLGGGVVTWLVPAPKSFDV